MFSNLQSSIYLCVLNYIQHMHGSPSFNGFPCNFLSLYYIYALLSWHSSDLLYFPFYMYLVLSSSLLLMKWMNSFVLVFRFILLCHCLHLSDNTYISDFFFYCILRMSRSFPYQIETVLKSQHVAAFFRFSKSVLR